MKSIRSSFAFYIDIALVMAVAFTRILSQSQYLHKWDSVQFALALSDYDITRHQPHPPGYPLYIGLAWIARRFVSDDNTALVLVGIISSAVIAVAVHRIGMKLFGERGGFTAGLLAVVNPLLWYFSSVALSYIVGTAVATVAVWVIVGAKGRMKWAGPVIAGIASTIWLPAGILVMPVCLWGILSEKNQSSLRAGIPWIAGCLGLFILPAIIGYLPSVLDTGGLHAFLAQVQSESGKHIIRFGDWARSPVDEFIATTGSIADFFKNGIGMGLWVLLTLLIPLAGEKGCDPKKVPGLLPLAIAAYAAMHWGLISTLRAAGIVMFAMAVFYLLPCPTTTDGRSRRNFFFWWLAPGLLLFIFVYINYVGIMIIFLPALILMVTWGIERASEFMGLQTVREPIPEEKSNTPGKPEQVPGYRTSPDLRVVRLVAWVLIALMAMNGVGGFVDRETQESWKGIMARDYYVSSVIDALVQSPISGTDLVILGGADDYRHWTYYLPDSEIIWTKYLLYEPIREGATIWVSRGRHQDKVVPEYSNTGNDASSLSVSFEIEPGQAVIAFPEEYERFIGTARITALGIIPGEEGSEPICYLIQPAGGARIVFSGGGWRFE